MMASSDVSWCQNTQLHSMWYFMVIGPTPLKIKIKNLGPPPLQKKVWVWFQNKTFFCLILLNEQPCDKTNKMTVCPAKTQFNLGINAQADLSLRWAHSHFVGFVMRWLKLTLSWRDWPTELGWKNPGPIQTEIRQLSPEEAVWSGYRTSFRHTLDSKTVQIFRVFTINFTWWWKLMIITYFSRLTDVWCDLEKWTEARDHRNGRDALRVSLTSSPSVALLRGWQTVKNLERGGVVICSDAEPLQ